MSKHTTFGLHNLFPPTDSQRSGSVVKKTVRKYLHPFFRVGVVKCSDVNKDFALKAKDDKAKDHTFKAKDKETTIQGQDKDKDKD